MEVIKKLFEHTKLTYYELSNIVKDVINRDDIATLDWIISTNKISIKKHRLDIGNILDYAKHINSIKIIDMLEHKYNLQPINPRFNTLTNIYVYLVNEHKIDISDDLLKNIVMEENIEAIKSLFEKCNKQQKKTLLRYAIVDSKLDTIKYLVEECKLYISDDLLKNIVMEENIEAIKSLFEKCDKQQKTMLLRYAIVNGKLDAVKYLVEECKLPIELYETFEKGKINIIKYLVDKHIIIPNYKSLYNAVRYNTIDVIKYLIEECKIQSTVNELRYAINNTIDVIKYFIEECKMKPTVNELKWAVARDSEHGVILIKYLIEECKIEPTEYILELAVRGYHYQQVTQYLSEEFTLIYNKKDMLRKSDIVGYLFERYEMKPPENILKIINDQQRWFDIIKYLIEENKPKLMDADVIEELLEDLADGDSCFDTIIELVNRCNIDPKREIFCGYNLLGYITSCITHFDKNQVYIHGVPCDSEKTLKIVKHLIERHYMDPKEKIYGGHNLITHTMKFNKELAKEILKYIIKKDFDIQLSSLIIE